MKAVLLNEFGGVDKLEYTDFPTPQIKPNEVLIKVAGVALNRLDLFVRKGIPGLILEMPHILGSDISGTITEVGSRVNIPSLDVGQTVVVDPGLSCGVCEFCRMGEISLCKNHFHYSSSEFGMIYNLANLLCHFCYINLGIGILD